MSNTGKIVEIDTGKIIEIDWSRMRTSLLQRLIYQFGGTSVSYPEKCNRCGRPVKGNIITGYRFSCRCAEGV